MSKRINADETITEETTIGRAAILRTLDGVDVDEADAMASVAAAEARRNQDAGIRHAARLSGKALVDFANLLGYNPRPRQKSMVLILTAIYLLSPEELAAAERSGAPLDSD